MVKNTLRRFLRIALLFAVLVMIGAVPSGGQTSAQFLSTCSVMNYPGFNSAVNGATLVNHGPFDVGDVLVVTDVHGTGLDHIDISLDGQFMTSLYPSQTWQHPVPWQGMHALSLTFWGTAVLYPRYTYTCFTMRLEPLADGRINPYDYAASATGFCADDGIDLYAISAEGAGSPAFHVSDDAISDGLAQARESGQHVLLDAQIGVQLWALADHDAAGHDQLQLMGPDGYAFIFPADRCD